MSSNGLRALDICRTELITADEHRSVVDIANLMREHGIGDVVITQTRGDEAVPAGIVTDRDIVVHAVAFEVEIDELTAGDLIHRSLVTVDCDADMCEIASTLNLNGIRRLLVTREEKIIGILSLDDMLMAITQIMNHISASLGRQIRDEKDEFSDRPAASPH